MKSLYQHLLLPLAAFSCVLTASATITVNSLEDIASPQSGVVTLRSALAEATSGESIIFDPSLNDGIITLSTVSEEDTPLIGEIMGIEDTPSGPISYLVGYSARNYGRSALYAHKNVIIDASALPDGITIAWGGGYADPARVLAVYGDLTLKNVSITGGRSVAVAIPDPDPNNAYAQLSTRARGGGLAVWGIARLENCRLFANECYMHPYTPARDRDSGVFGGGLYANIVQISDSTISGNSLSAIGVSGGGVFSVGGANASEIVSTIERSVITGNRIDGIFAYGAGVYSDGGGIGNRKTLELLNCTLAENRVGIVSGVPFLQGLYGSGYWRGGGAYMSNGHLTIRSCTIAMNEVYGVPRTNELSKPNMAGGVAATIGNAHAVENLTIGHSIIAGNTVHESTGNVYNQDIFTGSLFSFISEGYNRLGVIDFSQILVPISEPTWYSLSRKHYPKVGDLDGVQVTNVLDLTEHVVHSTDILSMGVNASNTVVLLYPPKGSALDQVPITPYSLEKILAEYDLGISSDNFLEILLGRIEQHYGITNFAATFTSDFENFLATEDTDDEVEGNQPHGNPSGAPILTLASTLWFGPSQTWPSKIYNYPYIEFWHRLDHALKAENIPGMGPELLGDDAWLALFNAGPLVENPSITMLISSITYESTPFLVDQSGTVRPRNFLSDIGAIESPPLIVPPPQMDGITVEGSNIVLRWSGHPDRTYSMWASTSLSTPDWTRIESAITNNTPVTILPAPEGGQFFKVEMNPVE